MAVVLMAQPSPSPILEYAEHVYTPAHGVADWVQPVVFPRAQGLGGHSASEYWLGQCAAKIPWSPSVVGSWPSGCANELNLRVTGGPGWEEKLAFDHMHPELILPWNLEAGLQTSHSRHTENPTSSQKETHGLAGAPGVRPQNRHGTDSPLR
jgi:hypothetical protein